MPLALRWALSHLTRAHGEPGLPVGMWDYGVRREALRGRIGHLCFVSSCWSLCSCRYSVYVSVCLVVSYSFICTSSPPPPSSFPLFFLLFLFCPPPLRLLLSSELTGPLGPAAPAEPTIPSQPVEIEIETPEVARKRQQKWGALHTCQNTHTSIPTAPVPCQWAKSKNTSTLGLFLDKTGPSLFKPHQKVQVVPLPDDGYYIVVERYWKVRKWSLVGK